MWSHAKLYNSPFTTTKSALKPYFTSLLIIIALSKHYFNFSLFIEKTKIGHTIPEIHFGGHILSDFFFHSHARLQQYSRWYSLFLLFFACVWRRSQIGFGMKSGSSIECEKCVRPTRALFAHWPRIAALAVSSSAWIVGRLRKSRWIERGPCERATAVFEHYNNCDWGYGSAWEMWEGDREVRQPNDRRTMRSAASFLFWLLAFSARWFMFFSCLPMRMRCGTLPCIENHFRVHILNDDFGAAVWRLGIVSTIFRAHRKHSIFPNADMPFPCLIITTLAVWMMVVYVFLLSIQCNLKTVDCNEYALHTREKHMREEPHISFESWCFYNGQKWVTTPLASTTWWSVTHSRRNKERMEDFEMCSKLTTRQTEKNIIADERWNRVWWTDDGNWQWGEMTICAHIKTHDVWITR